MLNPIRSKHFKEALSRELALPQWLKSSLK